MTRRCYPCQATDVPLVEVYLYGHTWVTCQDCAQLGVDHFGFFPREASKRALEDFARREVLV